MNLICRTEGYLKNGEGSRRSQNGFREGKECATIRMWRISVYIVLKTDT